MSIITSVRDRITRTLLSDNVRAMEVALTAMESAYRRGPYLLSEEQLIEQLTEADSYLVDYVLRQRNYQLLSGAVTEFGEEDRLRAVDEARLMFHYDVQVARAVQMWTDFGFGQTVEVKPLDESLAEVWDEFWTARRNAPILNQHRIHKLSNAVINDGEVFLVFFASAIGGKGAKTTVRRLETKQISRIVYEADDPDIPLFYVRLAKDLGEVWYPDWRATPEQLAAVELPRNAKLITDLGRKVVVDGRSVAVTSAKVLHIAYDDLDGRGWPVLGRVYIWSRVLRDFLGDRAAVARRVAMFVDEVSHSGGSRATAAIENKFNSALGTTAWGRDANPPPPAGSTLVHNKALDVQRRPLDTAARDAESDGQMLAGQVSAGTGAPLHWMGWPQALSNRATAREMKAPWVEQLERYQLMWTTMFQSMVEIVGVNAGGFEDYTSEVNLQNPLDVEIPEITGLMDSVTGALVNFAIDSDLAVLANNKLTERGLAALGITGVKDELEQQEQTDSEPVEPAGDEEQPEDQPAISDEVVLSAVVENVLAGEITARQAVGYLSSEIGAAVAIAGCDNGKVANS